LKQLGGYEYFGAGLINRLNAISKSPSYEMLVKVDEYKNQRAEFLRKLDLLSESFTNIGIKDYRPDSYEIGIVLPSEQDSAENVSKKIREFELLIKDVQELVGSEEKTVKITRVSNGSLEFFTSQPVEVVVVLTTILANVSQIWDKVSSLKKKQKEDGDSKILSDKAKGEMKKILDAEIASVKKEIEDELPEKILTTAHKTLEKGRKNEIRNSISMRVKVIFKWLEIGVELDIVPTRMTSPEQAANDGTSQAEILSTVKETNRALRKIYALPPEVKRLPFKLKEDDDEQEVEGDATTVTGE
jgi:hypothetical protein